MFMACYDTYNVPFSSDWVTNQEMPNPMQAAKHCVQSLGMNWTAIQACGGNISGNFWEPGNFTYSIGAQSTELITEAAQYFYDTFPMYRGIETPKFSVPHLYINDKEQALNNLANMWNTTDQLCQNGAHNAAVCKVIAKAQNPIWTGATHKAAHSITV